MQQSGLIAAIAAFTMKDRTSLSRFGGVIGAVRLATHGKFVDAFGVRVIGVLPQPFSQFAVA